MIGLCFWLSFLNISYWVGPTSNISPRVRTLRSWAKSWTKRMSQLETTSFTKNFLTWQDTRFLDSSTYQKSGWWFGRFFLFFPFSWECHHPNWRFVIFFRGVGSNHQPEMSILWEILLAESVEADGLKRQKYPSPKLQVLDSMGISGSDWLQVPTLYKVYVRPI